MAERYQLTLSMPNLDQQIKPFTHYAQILICGLHKKCQFIRAEETSCSTHQLLTNTELAELGTKHVDFSRVFRLFDLYNWFGEIVCSH